MAMCDHNPTDFIDLIHEITKIWDDVINTQHIVFREHDPSIDNEDVLPILDGHHVLSDFSQSP